MGEAEPYRPVRVVREGSSLILTPSRAHNLWLSLPFAAVGVFLVVISLIEPSWLSWVFVPVGTLLFLVGAAGAYRPGLRGETIALDRSAGTIEVNGAVKARTAAVRRVVVRSGPAVGVYYGKACQVTIEASPGTSVLVEGQLSCVYAEELAHEIAKHLGVEVKVA